MPRRFARDTAGRVPVTVLTGSLGAGKSTLLNHILGNKQGARICVIENEFGEVGVDEDLIKDATRTRKGRGGPGQLVAVEDEVIVQMNGCICCTVRKDLIDVLKRVLITERHPIDGIILETTGLADPAPVAQTFFVDPQIGKVAYLDAIITVVDAVNVLEQLNRERPEGAENEVLEQIAFADKIILNKIDLLGKEPSVPQQGADQASPTPFHAKGGLDSEVEADAIGSVLDAVAEALAADVDSHIGHAVSAVRNSIRRVNPTAEIIPAVNSVVPLEKTLGLNAFSLERVKDLDPEFLVLDKEHQHDATVGSICVVSEDPVSMPLLENWIGDVIRRFGANLYRYKGVLSAMGIDRRVVFQGVGMLFRSDLGTPWAESEKRVNKFVFIGKNLTLEQLQQEFFACTAKPLRFALGTRVLASVEGGPKPGKIIALWDEGNAYRVQLEDRHRTNVWAPIDIDAYIRQAQ